MPPKSNPLFLAGYCTGSRSEVNTTSRLPNVAVGKRAEVLTPRLGSAIEYPHRPRNKPGNQEVKIRILCISSHKALYFHISKTGVKFKLALRLNGDRHYHRNFVIQEIYFNIVCLFEKTISHSGLTEVSL